MESLYFQKFKIKDFSFRKLESQGYKKSEMFSDDERTVYWKRIMAHKYGDFVLLEAEILVDNKGNVDIDVFEAKTRSRYAAFYDRRLQHLYEPMLDQINKRILIEFKKIGARHVKIDDKKVPNMQKQRRKRRYKH